MYCREKLAQRRGGWGWDLLRQGQCKWSIGVVDEKKSLCRVSIITFSMYNVDKI